MLFESSRKLLLSITFTRNVYKKPFAYGYKYRGGFDYHNQENYPRRLAGYKEEELLNEVHQIKNKNIENPSPFHVVTRIKSMSSLPWTQKVSLRRLNLHSIANGEVAIVPNTPQYNDLLLKVKHVVQVKPAIFKNGRVPTSEDIGALKICKATGMVEVDEKLRLCESRINIGKPELFEGNFLRARINRMYGLQFNAPSIVKL